MGEAANPLTSADISRKLQDPFAPYDIEWRVQRCGIASKPWAAVLAYVTNRAIQQRLDDVVGFDKWRNEYTPTEGGKGFLCGLSINLNGEWVTKWDGAECTDIEPLKGGLSGSMKRAAVQWGIGRYLYNLETQFAVCTEVDSRRDSKNNYAAVKAKRGSNDKDRHIDWETPPLPSWALPGVEADDYSADIKRADSFPELKEKFADAYRFAKAFGRIDLQDRFKSEYESAKAKLDTAAQENIESASKEITGWLKRELQAASLIPDASAVSRVCESFRAKVKAKSDGQYYDTKPLFDMIDAAEKARIKDISSKYQGAQK